MSIMFQVKEIGKKRSKQTVFDAKKGRTFVTPENRSYVFDYRKEGNKYIVILCYNNQRMQVSEVDYNRIGTDILLKAIESES